jgi:hypothetical protein
MSIANVSRGNITNLPKQLRTAQESIHLPEVQEMLRKLSKYNLGIAMPHMHSDETGEFQALPQDLVQVEDGLEVSFRPAKQIDNHLEKYVPVAWAWREDAVTVMSMCYAYCEEGGPGPSPGHRQKHRKEE